VHHAVQQLRSGSSRVAIAAGANLILNPRTADLSVRASTHTANV
jgi:acyl transferase domain-containing protein